MDYQLNDSGIGSSIYYVVNILTILNPLPPPNTYDIINNVDFDITKHFYSNNCDIRCLN